MIAKLRPVDYVGAVVFLALTGLVIFGFNGGFADGKADAIFFGDSSATGARIYIDGELAGVLTPRDIGGKMTPLLETRVILGPRRLVAVSARGESLSMTYDLHESGRASVGFSKEASGR
ncbi:MAG: hypothetical protein ABIS67_13335 [Candidatus Eisenbacteria bacterium]